MPYIWIKRMNGMTRSNHACIYNITSHAFAIVLWSSWRLVDGEGSLGHTRCTRLLRRYMRHDTCITRLCLVGSLAEPHGHLWSWSTQPHSSRRNLECRTYMTLRYSCQWEVEVCGAIRSALKTGPHICMQLSTSLYSS